MDLGFVSRYQRAFRTIPGMFSFDAAATIWAYAQAMRQNGIAGHTMEIGVHHGLSSICIASARGDGSRFVAIDLFEELQDENVSRSGSGHMHEFIKNMRAHFSNLDFLQTIAKRSDCITPSDLGTGYSLCHVDGGHSARETFSDLCLTSTVLLPGGTLVLDDYFNPSFPGVCEGAIHYMIARPGCLRPLAIAFNKVLFQKMPSTFDVNAAVHRLLPGVALRHVEFWEQPTLLFASAVSDLLDLEKSAPHDLVIKERKIRALIEPLSYRISGARGDVATLEVRVENQSSFAFVWSDSPIGLSYHLKTCGGEVLAYDNPREYFRDALAPGDSRVIHLVVTMPKTIGKFLLELDLVWEGVLWFKDRGNPTRTIECWVN